MAALQFHLFPCLSDNYAFLGHSTQTGETFCVDAPDADAVLAAAKETGWNITHLFITHHHPDHVQGMAAVKAATGCEVIGPHNPTIAGIDRRIGDGESFSFAGLEVRVIATPGHTLDMLNFHIPQAKAVFTGDTLFALGCGRVFEGDMAMMWNSLSKLAKLPGDTAIYCGHEYTLSNGRFALTVDPGNAALQARVQEVEALRAAGKPTVPSLISEELATNPFLRAADPAIRAHLAMPNATDAEVFGELRERKNRG